MQFDENHYFITIYSRIIEVRHRTNFSFFHFGFERKCLFISPQVIFFYIILQILLISPSNILLLTFFIFFSVFILIISSIFILFLLFQDSFYFYRWFPTLMESVRKKIVFLKNSYESSLRICLNLCNLPLIRCRDNFFIFDFTLPFYAY